MKEKNFTMPAVMDPQQAAAQAFKMSGPPLAVIIDRHSLK
jgi:hypothetical protein